MGINERRRREKEQRRSDIIDSAERVFFSKGWTVATMDDVAADAELSKATLYLYFNSKEELYVAILLRGARILESKFREAVEGKKSGLEMVGAIGRAYVSFFREYPDYVEAMLYFGSRIKETKEKSDYLGERETLRRNIMGMVADAVKRGVDDGSIRSDVDPTKASVILWAQTAGLLQVLSISREDIESHYAFTAGDIVEAYFDFTFHALAADPQDGSRTGRKNDFNHDNQER